MQIILFNVTYQTHTACSGSLIIGGKEVKKPKPGWSHQVGNNTSVENSYSSAMGAVSLHTAESTLYRFDHMTVLVGVHSLSKDNAERVKVHSFHIPKTFSSETKADDIMLLKLQNKVQLKKNKVEVQTVPNSGKDVPADTKCIVRGWGTTQIEAYKSCDTLQEVEVTVIDRELCNCYYNRNPVITDDMLCAGNKQGNKDACWGDSGGPLECKKQIVGVVSGGNGCGNPKKPGSNEWSKNDERLLSAVEHGETEKVTSLLAKKGASACKLDGEGKSARGQAECLAVILSHGADVSVVDASAANGQIVIVQLLCEHKCPVNLKDTDGFTPLLLSAKHAHAEVCAILLDWGANINTCDRNGRSSIMLAAESSCVEAVDLLVYRGADLDLLDSLGHDVLHYAKLSGSTEVQAVISAALQLHLSESDKNSPGSQKLDVASPPFVTPNETPVSTKGDKRFNYKEEELRGVSLLRDEIEKLQKEKNMLLETIEDLKQIMEQTEPKASKGPCFRGCDGSENVSHLCCFRPSRKLTKFVAIALTHDCTDVQKVFDVLQQSERCGNSALLASLQAKVASLSLENQQLARIIKKRPPPQGEEGQEDSRPNSIDSNASYHSTHAEFHLTNEQELPDVSVFQHDVREEEITLLQNELQNLHVKLDESRLETESLQASLKPNSHTGINEHECLSESTAELKAKLDDQVVQKFQYLKGCLEQEVKDLKIKLAKLQEEKMLNAQLIKKLESESRHVMENERQELKNSYSILVENVNQEKALLIEKYKEAQDEIKMLQEALRGTVSVEAAAKDFEEMKAELGGVIEGLQKRLLELSKSYSEAKNELGEARGQFQTKALENSLKDTEVKYQSALKEISHLKQGAEIQAKSSVSIADHTQVVASLGNAIKTLESEVDVLKQQITQKSSQLDVLQNRLAVEKSTTPDDCVSKMDHEQMRESLERKINQLTQLLQDALRKQDEMALEVTAAWQEVKDDKNEKEAAKKLALAREQENNLLSGKCREAQEAIMHLKKQVENHVISEREKNKKIDDLSKEVGKLKEAINSLSQLSYTTSSSKSRQQNQQVDSFQQQIKQLQYQLAGQMDEDVQKALKQILLMCKIPPEDK
ncbi:Ankycorbin [Bagarius yarrelli]|uniref:Ankycorbin n=1 Tax=Bagarius yarrelli TaxID=175774 RepID=A0A556VVJ4_BAGYA|nr:Ankycorbin [Bagarius yarrelli]